ncbi:putative phospholipase D [Janthinobacterium sp. HH01]|nr:putative phospholipase D [Janthinobacterium sp. HH01]
MIDRVRRNIVVLALAVALAPAIEASAQAPAIENAFAPDAGGEALVLKVIDAATSKIRLAGYSFNSRHVMQALLNAKKRGVDVKVMVDARRNQRPASIAALRPLVNAGIPTRTVAVYAMHHDKYIVVDDRTVQNGSFNYSKDAATSNSENVLVVWDNPQLAKSFQDHWEDRWAKGVDYK